MGAATSMEKSNKSIVDREDFILRNCADKRVLHVGCADFPAAAELISRGKWLHDKLTAVASQCYGIDNSEEELAYLRSEYGFDNIGYGDAENLGDLNIGNFDVIVAGNVINYLSNPGLFFQEAKKKLNDGGILIITAINAFAARRFVSVLIGSERTPIYTTFYSSHYTLKMLAQRNGYAVEERHSYRLKWSKPLKSYLFERFFSVISTDSVEGLVHVWRPLGTSHNDPEPSESREANC